MPDSQLSKLTQSQRDRLAFIELRLRFFGEICRQDLIGRFGMQAAAATRDLAQYKELGPHNLSYDPKEKLYVRSETFFPVFDFSAERVLTWLAQGFGDAEPIIRQRFAAFCDGAGLPAHIDLELLSAVTRAIHAKSVLQVTYRSLSSGLTSREIVPFALANDGRRWHVRAFDRRTRSFRDFVLSRLASAALLTDAIADEERQDQDNQWNRIVELELVPHPANVQHPDTIEAEYGMVEGVLPIRIRAALAGYLLRHWNVDCTERHALRGAEFHLWLRNRPALYGVSNLVLAPGYELASSL